MKYNTQITKELQTGLQDQEHDTEEQSLWLLCLTPAVAFLFSRVCSCSPCVSSEQTSCLSLVK